MSEEIKNDNTLSERDALKARADMMGLQYAGNISTDKLRDLVNSTLEKGEESVTDTAAKAGLSIGKIRDNATQLVRIRLTCHNPNKINLPGEVFTIANQVIGKVSRYVPFGAEFYNDGWHVERCIVDMLKAKTYSAKRVEPLKSNNKMHITRLVQAPEFTITELPPLTEAEIAALAKRQAETQSLKDN